MRVEFLEKFNKDLDKVKVKHVKEAVLKTILKVEEAKSLAELTHLKKLKEVIKQPTASGSEIIVLEYLQKRT